MVKRITILAVLLASFGAFGSANAACGGHRAGGTVPAQRVTGVDDEGLPIIDAEDTVTVTFTTSFINICDDGSVTFSEGVILGAASKLTIEGDSDSCTADTASDWDPFGFGVGVHDLTTTPTCAIDITWSGFTSPWIPDAVRTGTSGVFLSKTTNHENGVVQINGKTYRAHGEAIGTLWTGVGGEV